MTFAGVRRLFILLGLLPLFMACAPVQVSQDFDRNYPFAAATTFNWNEELQQQNDERFHIDELLASRFKTAIEDVFTRQGFRQAAQPDFLVSYMYEVSSRIQVDDLHTHFGYGYGRYGRYGAVGFDTGSFIQQYDQGKLVINVHDSRTGHLFWKGIGTREVFTHSSPEQLTRRVNEMVSAILAQFPPLRQ
ncbi:DUF4136 domain-containing protein [Desulfocastanea catecholica]